MRILRDFKLPDFKFPKMKMEGMENIQEMQVNYEQIDQIKDKKLKNKYYEETHSARQSYLCVTFAFVNGVFGWRLANER